MPDTTLTDQYHGYQSKTKVDEALSAFAFPYEVPPILGCRREVMPVVGLESGSSAASRLSLSSWTDSRSMAFRSPDKLPRSGTMPPFAVNVQTQR